MHKSLCRNLWQFISGTNPYGWILAFVFGIPVVIFFMLFMSAPRADENAPLWGKNIAVDTFYVKEVGTCMPSGKSSGRCAYVVDNGKEVWNLVLSRPLNVGWSVTRIRWVTFWGEHGERWQ